MNKAVMHMLIGAAATGLVCAAIIFGMDRGQETPQKQPAPVVQPRTPPAGPARAVPPSATTHDHTQPANTDPALGQPPIQFSPEMLDLGIVRPNRVLNGTVNIKNTSDKELKVLSAKADCTCTSVHLPPQTVAPGQSITFDVEYRSNSAMGDKTGGVRILFEGYDLIEFPVRAYVTMPVRAEPPHVVALQDESGKVPVSGEFDVLSNDQKPFRITAVNGKPPLFVNFDPVRDQSRNIYRLKWDFSGFDPRTCLDKDGKRLPAWIAVETDHPECAVFDLEVRHECNRRTRVATDTWVVQEKRVLVGGLKPGEPMDFEVVAKWLPRAPAGDLVKTAVSESSEFDAELLKVEPLEDGAICHIRITPRPDHRGLVYGNVRLYSMRQNSTFTVIGAVH